MIAPPVAILTVLACIWSYLFIFSGYLDFLIPVKDRPIPSLNEPVLKPGMKLLVHGPTGDITILAGAGRKRTFDWDNGSRSAELDPRMKRWHGNLGLYRDGHWFPHRGIGHYLVEEGQLNFSSVEKAEEYLSRTPACVGFIYRNDGLTAWISKQKDHISVDILQVYVNGVKPRRLNGAQDDKLLLPLGECTAESTNAPADLNDIQEMEVSHEVSKSDHTN